MLILVRTSRWAVWARRLGSFGLPLAVIPILMHRGHAIDTGAFELVEGVAIVVALLGLLASFGAFIRIWTTGDHGWGRAVAGLLLSLACLVPVGFLVAEYFAYPMADNITTDPANPPPLVSATPFPATPSSAVTARLAAAFPSLKGRNYALPPDQLYNIVVGMAADRGWDVLRAHAPDEQGQGGQLNALATTVLGFRDEVAIRLDPTVDGTSVAMRSTSLAILHEPGVNGTRIKDFLSALDDSITALQKVQSAGTADESDDADQPPIPAPAPTLRRKR